MTWENLDWAALARLREQFLSGPSLGGVYWQAREDLASYDLTYGERIGWKWDHVLRELRLRGWRPRSRHVFDWGCGSGVAARRVISRSEEHTSELQSPCNLVCRLLLEKKKRQNVSAIRRG